VVAIEICTGNGYQPTVPGTECAAGDTSRGNSDDFSIAAQKINVPVNTVIFVDMWAGAKAARDGHASAWVDPYFVIDPGFASAKLYSLVFSPGIIQLQPAAAEWVQKAYVAYYGRPADPAGLAWWADRLVAEGGELASIIAAFGTSDEFARRYGGKTFEELIEALYRQALGRVPDPAGRLWYLGQLILGATTLQTITLDLLGGATGQDALTVAHRLAVASYYTDAVAAGCSYGPPGEEEATGVASLAAVTSDPATVVAAKAAIDSRCGR
jgi:hypothetical protein